MYLVNSGSSESKDYLNKITEQMKPVGSRL